MINVVREAGNESRRRGTARRLRLTPDEEMYL